MSNTQALRRGKLAAMMFVTFSLAVSGLLAPIQTAAAAESDANLWAVPVNSRIDDGRHQILKLRFHLDTGNEIDKIRITLDGTRVLEFEADGSIIIADPAFVSVEGSVKFDSDGYMISKVKGKFTIAIDKSKLTEGEHSALAEIIREGGETITDDAKFKLRPSKSAPSDLVPVFFRAPNNVEAGKKHSAILVEENEGISDSKDHTVKIYLSEDDVLDSGDLQVGQKHVDKIKAGKLKIMQVKFELPSDADLGSFHLIVKVDAKDQVSETNENNNTSSDSINVTAKNDRDRHGDDDDDDEDDDENKGNGNRHDDDDDEEDDD
jgi:hypothetical protein